MILPGIFAILVVSIIFFGILGVGDNLAGGVLRSYYLVFIGLVAILCMMFIKLLNGAKTYFVRASKPALILYMLVGITCGSVAVAYIPDQTTSDNPHTQQGSVIIPELAHDPVIIQRLHEIGVTDATIFEKSSQEYVDDFSGSDAILSEQGGIFTTYTNPIDGSFSYGVLKVKKGFSPDRERTVIAHEYLHYIWSNKIEKDNVYRDRLTSELITLYGKDASMQRRIDEYSKKGILRPTELFAYYCTESSDRFINDYVYGECSKYINRNTLVMER